MIMKQKSNNLSFFICAFLITLTLIVSVCLIASLELKNDSLYVDFDSMTAKIFGNTYALDKNVLKTLSTILQFNKVFVGDVVFDTIKNAFFLMLQTLSDILRIIFYGINTFVNSSAITP